MNESKSYSPFNSAGPKNILFGRIFLWIYWVTEGENTEKWLCTENASQKDLFYGFVHSIVNTQHNNSWKVYGTAEIAI